MANFLITIEVTPEGVQKVEAEAPDFDMAGYREALTFIDKITPEIEALDVAAKQTVRV